MDGSYRWNRALPYSLDDKRLLLVLSRSSLRTLKGVEIMKRMLLHHLTAAAILALLFYPCQVVAKSPPKKGGKLPKVELRVPRDPTQRSYLGLSGDGVFRIPQVKAQVVIIELFNTY
jgi:hypothetical protein